MGKLTTISTRKRKRQENGSHYVGPPDAPAVRLMPSSATTTPAVGEHSSPSGCSTPSASVERERVDEEVDLVTSPASSQGSLSESLRNDVEDVGQLLRNSSDFATALRQRVESSMSTYTGIESEMSLWLAEFRDGRSKTNDIVNSRDPAAHQVEVVQLNIGGAAFTVPTATLLGKDSPSLFHVLLGAAAMESVAPVFKDENNVIFIDRDPECFKHIVDYLRGYRYFPLLKEEIVRKLKVDAVYYQLPGLLSSMGETEQEPTLQFAPGPGVNPERNRLRVVYGVAAIGDVFLVTGRHRITFEVKVAEYVGFGMVSDSCVSTDQEFHKTPECCVYYMSGVFYTNYPYHRKEENLEKIEHGDFITIKVDMDKGYAEFVLKDFRKIFSLGRARRLKFAVTMKLSSRVRIVPEDEVRSTLPAAHYTFND